MKIQFLTDGDNYEALYINGIQVLSGHTLQPDDVARAIVGDENVESVNLWDYDDEVYTFDGDGNSYVNGIRVWTNGKGFAENWPFPVE